MTTHERFARQLMALRQLGEGDSPARAQRLSPTQIRLLDLLAADLAAGSTAASTINQLARALALKAPTVSVAVAGLEKIGLVARAPDPADDARLAPRRLTDAGQDLQRRIDGFRQAKVARLLDKLTPREQETLTRLLERVLASDAG